MERVTVSTADGHDLAGDLVVPADTAAGAVICHPHPQLGGTRHDHVVTALFDELARRDLAVLRFDFRRDFGGGIAERLDAEAAVRLVAERTGGRPVHLVGYSFGALVTLTAEVEVAARVAVAPPLSMAVDPVAEPLEPTLLVVAEHDGFCPPDEVRRLTAGWSGAETIVAPGADHLFSAGAYSVARSVGEWVERRSPS